MQAEPSYVTGLVRRIIRLLSGMIVGVLLLLIFERITVIDALFLIVMSVLFSAYLTRNEGHALAQLKNYFRAKAGADKQKKHSTLRPRIRHFAVYRSAIMEKGLIKPICRA